MRTRREFLKGLASASAGVCFFGCGMERAPSGPGAESAQSGGAGGRREVMVGGRRVRTVDVHAHCYSLEVWDIVKDREESRLMRNILNRQGQDFDLNSVDHRLSQMDALGMDVQALSVAPELHYWAEEELARRIVQVENEKIAEVCAGHPDRFVGIGGVALQHVDLALEQLEYGVRNLDLRGFVIGGRVNGEEIAAEKFLPFWAKVEELGTVIFIHPRGFPDGAPRFAGNGYLTNVIGNPLETTVALSHLIFEGVLDRYPGLKICGYHGGGFLPSYIGRSDFCAESHPNCKPVNKLPSEYIKQLYFDSLVFNGEGLRHLAAVAGASQVLLGTDFPTPMEPSNGIDHILETLGVSDADKEAMLGGNAARLLRIAG